MITIDEPGIPSIAPNFDDPIGLIKACHERIAFHCDLLSKTMSYLSENGVDEEAVEAARKVYRYFSTAGKLHHQDEEQDIFPRLIRVSMKLADIINTLKHEHQSIDKLWDTLSVSLDDPGTITPEQLPELKKFCAEFYRLNLKHIKFEEEELLSIASHMINNDELKLIGASMKERRHIN